MAATVYQQPPSPPHSKAHYFPPSSTMLARQQQQQQSQPQQQPPYHDPQPHHHPQRAPAAATPAAVLPAAIPVASSSSKKHSVDAQLVKSKLPTGLPIPAAASSSTAADDDHDLEGTQEATVTWRGHAKEVYLTTLSDHDRPFKIKMVHEPGSKSTFFATLRLPPGHHPLRFIADDQPKCTDTLPIATDVDGTLINYIEIPSPSHSPIARASWDAGGAGSVLAGGPSAQGKQPHQYPDMEWSEQIPPRLFALAAAEEQYLAARAAAATPHHARLHPAASAQYQLPPPPPVPYPPSLPRHLEKVILNSSSSRNPNAPSFTPAILASPSSNRPRIIGTGTTGPLIPPPPSRPRSTGLPPNGTTIPAATTTTMIPSGLSASGGILVSGTGGGEGAGDDNSVLPVPNHVVLNHLGTSAIKNGVLAVGTTMRYHRKYISTIYYKPI